MEEIMKRRTCQPNMAPSALSMHKDSHVISKFKPKIRIIHIFAPEIIKTDVANFRELVQRLTGKPTNQKGSKKKKTRSITSVGESRSVFCKPAKTTMVDVRDGFQSSGYGDRIKGQEDEEIWRSENSNGFFGGLGDLDGFIQGLGEFPLLPLNSSHMDMFGETLLS